MTFETQVQYFDAAQRLLAEAGRVEGERVRRALERLSAVYFYRACGIEGGRVQPAPLAAAACLERKGRD